MDTLTLRLLDDAISVRSAAPEVMTWLREIYLPAATEPDRSLARVTVTVRDDLGSALSVAAEDRVPCFALGEELVWLPARRDDPTLVLEDEQVGARYELVPGRVDIARLDGARPRLRWAVVRVLGELVAAQSPASPRVDLHASGFVHEGRAVLLCGPKLAGKTTTLVQIAALNPCSVFASDRVILCRSTGGVRAHAVPSVVSIRPQTVALLPGILGTLESRTGASPPRNAYLSMTGLARLLERPQQGPAELGCLAFVSVADGVAGFDVRPLAAAEAEARIRANCRRERDGPRPVTVFEQLLGHRDPARDDPALIADLATGVPCFDLRVGGRFVREPRLARQLFADLTGSW